MDTKEQKKSGRTPEQQAARDARKAAKLAAAAAAAATTAEATTDSAEAGPSSTKKSKFNEEDYEINVDAPEPLSKAEVRAAKRRAKRGEAEEEGKPKKRKRLPSFDPAEGDEDGDGRASKTKSTRGNDSEGGKGGSRPAKQNSIWIGNLSFKTTPDSLKAWLLRGVEESGGEKDCVTRVNLPKKNARGGYAENKGYAYVDFTSPEMQKLAVGLSERLLEGRKLLIKLGTDHSASEAARTPKPSPFTKNQPHGESATLFVGNLPFDATEEGLRDMVEANARGRVASKQENDDDEEEEDKEDADEDDAQVAAQKQVQAHRGGVKSGLRKVRLGAFQDTGRCKGFAFLDFIEPANATAALSNRKNHFYGGRKITLQYASQDATKRAGGKRREDDAKAGAGAGARPRRSGRDEYEEGPEVRGGAAVDESALARAVLGGVTGGAEGDAGGYGGERRERRDKDKDARGKKWETAGRARPGAALAMAKREKVGIVPGAGTKISFD